MSDKQARKFDKLLETHKQAKQARTDKVAAVKAAAKEAIGTDDVRKELVGKLFKELEHDTTDERVTDPVQRYLEAYLRQHFPDVDAE